MLDRIRKLPESLQAFVVIAVLGLSVLAIILIISLLV
jgi:hypothetical protein